MRALLDVNMLIALFDAGHTAHEAAHAWWAAHHQHGWASCAITENGMIRIMSLPRYRPEAPLAIGDLIRRFRQFAAATDHRFWPSEVSLCDQGAIAADHILGSRAITDVWLLALPISSPSSVLATTPSSVGRPGRTASSPSCRPTRRRPTTATRPWSPTVSRPCPAVSPSSTLCWPGVAAVPSPVPPTGARSWPIAAPSVCRWTVSAPW